MEQEVVTSMKFALGRYAPAPNNIKENWTKDIERNIVAWGDWMDAPSFEIPKTQAVWTEGEVVKCIKYALQNLPKEKLIDNGLYDRGDDQRFPDSAYVGRITDENMDVLSEILDVTKEVSEILSDTVGGKIPLSQACRNRKMDYIRFRRFCERFLQVRDGGRHPTDFLPVYEPSMEEKLYARIFGVSEEEALTLMPDDAEETIERILTEMPEKESDIIKRRLAGETLIDIGASYDVSKERIRQLEAKTLRKLRNPAMIRLLTIGVEESDKSAALREQEMQEKNRMIAEQQRLIDDRTAQTIEKYSNVYIEELEPSVRLFNVLCRSGVRTVGDLLTWDWHRLSRIHNMGKKSLEELRDKLNAIDIKLPERMSK